MSNFIAPTRYPDEVGKIQPATWLDDYFGPHEYGVRFPDGKVFHEKEIRYMTTALFMLKTAHENPDLPV